MKLPFKGEPKLSELDKEIEAVTEALRDMKVTDPQYKTTIEMLERLQRIKTAQVDIEQKRSLSPDTIANVAANLLGIGVICNFEKVHVITSKALGFVSKLRLK